MELKEKVHILLVEDDNSLGYILREYLTMHEFQVTWAKDGELGLEAFENEKFDLCILDVMMPRMDGFTLAENLRARNSSIPIIFLTAKALKVDKLKGFKIGADDYIVKPVDEEELIARINAIIKRSIATSQPEPERFTIGKYEFDFSNQALYLGTQKQTITTKEAEVLKQLCLHKGQIMDREQTLKNLWGHSDYFNRRSMDVFISKLRKYLSGDEDIKIINVHGKGFVLED